MTGRETETRGCLLMCSCTGSLLKCVQWLRKDQDLGTHLGSPHDGMGYFYFSIFCCLPGCARERRWECGMWVEPELKSWHSHTGCRYSNCFLLLRLSSYLSCSTMSQIQIQTPCKLFFFSRKCYLSCLVSRKMQVRLCRPNQQQILDRNFK